MTVAVSKAQTRAARAQNAARYQQKHVQSIVQPKPIVDLRLRRLTTKLLEDLKRPDTIPSTVIYAALEQAASGK